MKRILISIILVLGGLAVFVFGSPYYSVFPTNGNQVYCLALTLFFLVLALVFRRVRRLAPYAPASYALFTASAALLFLNTGVLNLHDASTDPLPFIALDKLSQFLHVVPVILLLTLVAGNDFRSVFLDKGRLRQGLTFGLVSLVVFAVIAVVLQLGSHGALSSLPAAIPWLLLFVFANAIMEELWLRAIFLRPYGTLVGRWMAVLITAVVFGTSHISATYDFPGGGIIFGLVVFGLGLVGAHAMQKDESLIGPVLFHAGYDLLIIVPILNSL